MRCCLVRIPTPTLIGVLERHKRVAAAVLCTPIYGVTPSHASHVSRELPVVATVLEASDGCCLHLLVVLHRKSLVIVEVVLLVIVEVVIVDLLSIPAPGVP